MPEITSSRHAPEKRSAGEPVTRILAADDHTDPSGKRPSAITGGAIAVLLRAVGGVLAALALIGDWPEIRDAAGLEPGEESRLVLVVLLCGIAIWIAVLLLFAWLLWRGSNWARLLVMFWVTASVISAAIAHFSVGAEITLRTTLLTLSLDILVLLALSSRNARAWTRARSASASHRLRA